MKLIRAAAMVLTAVMLGGCFFGSASTGDDRADLVSGDLVGVWQNNAGDTLTFEQNGQFAANNLPYEEFEDFPGALPGDFDPVRDKLPASGSWEVAASREDPSGPRNRVKLYVKELAGRPAAVGAEMWAEKQDQSVVLAFYIGDPDLRDRRLFQKTPR
ncbi:hypothetical protein [Micromonospora sp. U21]|uniref:hypothetical protein n=1 Tax=Micromonospora sp. U21 TaxID=2824899 RepID=UPI001B389D97|nr:hypothetical protein [Micromonospora sp. U21]MBQ0901307.1 hypothetical protein [Micromonospora sp. U21]